MAAPAEWKLLEAQTAELAKPASGGTCALSECPVFLDKCWYPVILYVCNVSQLLIAEAARCICIHAAVHALMMRRTVEPFPSVL